MATESKAVEARMAKAKSTHNAGPNKLEEQAADAALYHNVERLPADGNRYMTSDNKLSSAGT